MTVLPQAERSKTLVTLSRETPLRRATVTAIGPDVTTVAVGDTVLVNILAAQRIGDEDLVLPVDAVVATFC